MDFFLPQMCLNRIKIQEAETWEVDVFLPNLHREQQLCQVTQLFIHPLLNTIQRELFHSSLSRTILKYNPYYVVL